DSPRRQHGVGRGLRHGAKLGKPPENLLERAILAARLQSARHPAPDGARKSLRRRLLEGEGLGDDDDGTGCPRRELHLQIARLRYGDVVRARREVGAGAIRGGPPLPGDRAVMPRAVRAETPYERLVARCPPARRGEREDQERERQSASDDRPSFPAASGPPALVPGSLPRRQLIGHPKLTPAERRRT